VADVGKNVEPISDVVESAGDTAKTAGKVADTVGDALKTADRISDAADTTRTIDSAKGVLSNLSKEYKLVNTRNSILAGQVHPKTGIHYKMRKLKYSGGRMVKGVFPEFDSYADIQLPKRLYGETEARQNDYCLKALSKDINSMLSKFKSNFSSSELALLAEGKLPPGFTWHHNEKEGLMQLVETRIHSQTAHTGGMSLWGAGY